MARFLPAVLAALLSVGIAFAQDRDDPNKSFERVVAVQNALYLGRQHLQKNEAKQAVTALEAELPNCNGSKDYLATLRDAYYAYLMDLQRNKQTDQIPVILGRLRKLDPSAKLDGFSEAPPKTVPPLPVLSDVPTKKFRAQADDRGDPFQQTPIGTATGAQDLLRKADLAFSQERFDEAGRLFERANAKDPALTPASKGRWAYCILKSASDRLAANPPADELRSLEEKTQQAISMVGDKPEMQKYGETMLHRIREMKTTSAALPAPAGDFAVYESANFRVLHRSTREFAERFAAAAEKARESAFEKWFGPAPGPWTPRCEIYVYTNADGYIRAAKGHPQSHGFTTVEVNAGRATRRRIDLVGDNPNLVTAALPREMTHVVLADLFAEPLLPRWADEAMAILAEPRANVDLYLRAVPECRREGKIFAVGPLLQSTEFPDASAVTPFYAESVSLVDMLVAMKGPKEFSVFLNAARRYGYEGALKRNYNIQTFSELQERWTRHSAAQGLE
jgi:tetratricopeptide (TPR) repeat protein